MQSFTQTEIKWMIGALKEKARAYHEAAAHGGRRG